MASDLELLNLLGILNISLKCICLKTQWEIGSENKLFHVKINHYQYKKYELVC